MLLTSIEDVPAGAKVGAVVLHPVRPELELLSAGTVLEASMLARLRQLGVRELWIHHNALADLDQALSPKLTQLRREVFSRIKEDFELISQETVSTARLRDYRQAILRLVFELVGNVKVAGLTDMLFSDGEDALFSHCANVAYLATLIGLEMETYIITERKRLSTQHARDLSALGLGAMLHDLGKVELEEESREVHEVSWQAPGGQGLPVEYLGHTLTGYRMLSTSQAPASAKLVVLNHHQRFNGQGWPNLSGLAKQKGKRPVQAQREIHIFSRIVAVANVLDNLMRDGKGQRRPPVAALFDLQSARFDGWFDPVIRQAMLRKLPPFQIGTRVQLSDGRAAAVVAPNLSQPCRPVVRILGTGQDSATSATAVNVALQEHPQVKIVAAAGVDVRKWLFTLPELPKRKERAK